MTATELLRNLGTGSEVDKAFTRQQNLSDSDIALNRAKQLIYGMPGVADWAISRGALGADMLGSFATGQSWDEMKPRLEAEYGPALRGEQSPISSVLMSIAKGEPTRSADLWGPELQQATEQTEQTRADEALLGGLGKGTGGELAADMIMFGIPTSRVGSMANTRRFLQSGSNSLKGLTKAAAKDSAFNAAAFAPTDYALSKAYGLSDGEALINAVSAGAIGGLGSPVVSGVMGRKVIGKAMQNAIDKTANLQPKLSTAQRPEIYIDGHYFPDEKIKDLGDAPVGKEPTVRPKTGMPEKGIIPSDEVLRENVAKPNAEKYNILRDPTHPEFEKTLRSEIYKDLGYRRFSADELANAGSELEYEKMLAANKRADEASKDIWRIMNDEKARQVYLDSIIQKYKPKRSEPVSSKPLSTDEAIIVKTGGEPDVVRQGAKVPRDMVQPKKQRVSPTATPLEPIDIPPSERLRKITESQDRMAKMRDIQRVRRVKKATPEQQTSNIKRADSRPEWGDKTRRPGWDEATVAVKQDDATKLGTERVYDGPTTGKRITPDQLDEAKRAREAERAETDTFDMDEFEYKQKLAEAQKVAVKRGYDRVKRGGKPLSRSKIDSWVKKNVPEYAQSSYKQGMIDASEELQKLAREKSAAARKAPKVDPEKVKKADEIVQKNMEKRKKQPKPTGAKPGDVQAKIDAEAKAREAELKKAEADTQAKAQKVKKDISEQELKAKRAADKAKKLIDEAKKTKSEESVRDLAKYVVDSERPVSFKLKDAQQIGYVPDHANDVYEAILKEYGDIEVRLEPSVKSNGKEVGGYYEPDGNYIAINAKRLKGKESHSIVHEALHAISWHKLREDPKLARRLQGMMNQTQDWFKKNRPEVANNYAFKNLDEFFAEALSNPGLMRELKKIPYESQTLWEKIKDFVARLFTKPEDHMYRNIFRTMEEMIEPPTSVKAQRLLRKANKKLMDVEVKTDKMRNMIGIGSKFLEGVDNTITSWRAGYAPGKPFREFRELNMATREALNEAAKYKDNVREYIEEVYKNTGHRKDGNFDTEFTRAVLKTDYRSIQEFGSQKEANDFLRKHKDLYVKGKKFIDQTAKGMKNRGGMNSPWFSNNAYQIAQRIGMKPEPETLSIIDKLISIKAMSDYDWKFIKKYKGTEEFESMMTLVDQMKIQSDDLFRHQPWKSQKGYISEVYESIYTYKLQKNGEFVKELDLDPGNVQGALPQQLDSASIGTKITEPKFKGMTPKMMEIMAESKGLGLILDVNANPKAFRRVANEAQRWEMGRSDSALDTIALTMENNVRKLSQDSGVNRLIYNMAEQGNELFSPYKKKGFVALKDDEINMLPRGIRDAVRYVNPEFKQMLIGNKEITLASSPIGKLTERVLKDTVQHFKENVVLKNPASWVNNTVFAVFMNMQEGISVRQSIKLMREGLEQKAEAQRLLKKKFRLELQNKTNTQQYRDIENQLSQNLYYQFDKNGLAVTVMSNVLDAPNTNVRFTDKAVKQFFDNEFGKGNPIYGALAEIYMHPASKTGRIAMSAFGSIDSMSRYSLAKHHMNSILESMGKKNTKVGSREWKKALDEGILKANSVYGDMDMITPMWSQAIQQYGFVPFSNWFFRVSGGLNRSVEENLMMALAVYAGLSMLEDQTGYRTESWNPLAALTHTPIDMIEMSPYNRPVNALKSATMPSVYRKAINAVKYDDPMSIFITEVWDK